MRMRFREVKEVRNEVKDGKSQTVMACTINTENLESVEFYENYLERAFKRAVSEKEDK